MRTAIEWKGILAAEEDEEEMVASGTIAFAPSRLSDTRYVKTTTARRIAAMKSNAVTPSSGQGEQGTLSLAVVAQFGRHWEHSSEEGSWPSVCWQSPAPADEEVDLFLAAGIHAALGMHSPKMWASQLIALNPSAGRIAERLGTFEQSAPRNRGRQGLQV